MPVTKATYPITLGDQEFNLTPLSIKDIETIDNWLRKKVIRSAAEASSEVDDPALSARIMDSAMSKAASISMLTPSGMSSLMTPLGIAKIFHVSLIKEHPDLTLEDIASLVSKPGAMDSAFQEFQAANDMGAASGTDEPGPAGDHSPDPTKA